MQNIITALNEAIVSINGGATIKATVAELESSGVDVTSFDTKTKAAFITGLEAKVTELAETTIVSELDMLKVEISEAIQTAGKATFQLGKLLLKARDACETQADFLIWVDSNFGIKKAWAFKLMKVSQVFDGEPWNKVPATVLYLLHCQANDEQMLEAKKFAEVGKLTTATVQDLLAPPVPQAPKGASHEEINEAADKATTEALADTFIADASAPIKGSEQPPAAPSPSADTGLLLKIEELLALNAELQGQIQELTKPRLRSGSDMPMLPQFNSPHHYVRLGLSQEDSKDKQLILDAFKAMCKAGYGRAHEAFALLDEARHELIHAL